MRFFRPGMVRAIEERLPGGGERKRRVVDTFVFMLYDWVMENMFLF